MPGMRETAAEEGASCAQTSQLSIRAWGDPHRFDPYERIKRLAVNLLCAHQAGPPGEGREPAPRSRSWLTPPLPH